MIEEKIIEAFAEAEAFGEEVKIFAKKFIELCERWNYDPADLAGRWAKIVNEVQNAC